MGSHSVTCYPTQVNTPRLNLTHTGCGIVLHIVYILLQVTTFNNELQAQGGPGFSWILFDSSADVAAGPTSKSSRCFTFTDDDAQRVRIHGLVL